MWLNASRTEKNATVCHTTSKEDGEGSTIASDRMIVESGMSNNTCVEIREDKDHFGGRAEYRSIARLSAS